MKRTNSLEYFLESMKKETSKRIRDLELSVGQLQRVIELTFWCSRRYANLRMTSAPSMVRNAWKVIQAHPEWNLPHTRKYDDVIGKPFPYEVEGSRKDDDLRDCMNPEQP